MRRESFLAEATPATELWEKKVMEGIVSKMRLAIGSIQCATTITARGEIYWPAAGKIIGVCKRCAIQSVHHPFSGINMIEVHSAYGVENG